MRRKENEVSIHFFIKCFSFETLKLIPKGLNEKFRLDIEISFLLRYRHISANGILYNGLIYLLLAFSVSIHIYLSMACAALSLVQFLNYQNSCRAIKSFKQKVIKQNTMRRVGKGYLGNEEGVNKIHADRGEGGE